MWFFHKNLSQKTSWRRQFDPRIKLHSAGGGEKGTVQDHLGVPQAVHETHKDRQLLPNLNPFSYFNELQKNDFEIIDGYIGVETGGCNDQKDLGSCDSKSRDGCRDWCNEKDDCVSFAYSQYGRKCQLSSTCRSPSETVYEKDSDHDGFFFYVKKSKVVKADRVEGYVPLNTGGCKGKNELGTYEMPTAADCAAECNQHHDCVSFEFGKLNRFCSLSKTCHQKSRTVNEKKDPNYWYTRASKIENNAENVNTDDFHVLDTGGCGFNGKGRYFVSVEDCANKCLEDDSCASRFCTQNSTGGHA